MPGMLDVFYFPGSTYTYLTAMRAEATAQAAGIQLRWRPFNVRTIMVEMDNVPFAKKPVKARYMWRDIERRAKRYGLPWTEQPPYPVDPQLKALRLAAVATLEGHGAAFVEASYRAWLLRREIPGVEQNTESVLASFGMNVSQAVERARSSEISRYIEIETHAARSLGVFGSPTFASGEEIFWGDDRLEDAIEWAAQKALRLDT